MSMTAGTPYKINEKPKGRVSSTSDSINTLQVISETSLSSPSPALVLTT